MPRLALPSSLLLALFLCVPLSAQKTSAPIDAGRSSELPVPDGQGEAVKALTFEEIVHIEALEGGRYIRDKGRFFDTRVWAPLSEEAVQGLLRGFLDLRLAELRERRDAPREEDVREARRIFWGRGPLLREEEKSFLRELIDPRYGKMDLRAKGEGKGGAGGVVAGTAGADGAALAQARDLAQRLRAQLDLDDHGDPRQAEGLRRTIDSMLQSPTARALAEELIARGMRVKVSYEDLNAQVISVNGKKILVGNAADAPWVDGRYSVRLSRGYLDTDPQYQRYYAAGTLAHELLGHTLMLDKAVAAGVGDSYYSRYRGNEANAGLVGWLVEAELGAPLNDGHMWNYLRDSEEYHKSLQTNLPYYATIYSAEELKTPVEVLSKRLKGTRKARADAREYLRREKSWKAVALHFIVKHGLDRGRFKSLLEGFENSIGVYYPQRFKAIDAIETHQKNTLAWYASADGQKLVREMSRSAGSPFFAEAERGLQEKADRLRSFTEKRQPEEFSPPPPGQVTMEELVKMHEADQKKHAKDPGHWK